MRFLIMVETYKLHILDIKTAVENKCESYKDVSVTVLHNNHIEPKMFGLRSESLARVK